MNIDVVHVAVPAFPHAPPWMLLDPLSQAGAIRQACSNGADMHRIDTADAQRGLTAVANVRA
jgi:hypothetical protein